MNEGQIFILDNVGRYSFPFAMARPLRIQYENAYYHVTCRGNARQQIFGKDEDRSAFLNLLNRSRQIVGR